MHQPPAADLFAYRPDIDGLRAVAVLAVLVFHAFPAWLPGGFVGVDVFFVISGYLITILLQQNSADGNFSLLAFYGRRIRRIFPALLLMLATVWGLAYGLLMPGELQELGRSMVYSAFFGNNFLLVSQAGYFDMAAELKPLLHLWSLAVEEQFYIVWPWLALFIWRGGRGRRTFFLALIAASLLAAVIATSLKPVEAFFLPQYRAWELLAGALLAFHGNSLRGQWLDSWRAYIGGFGVALIVIACLWIQGNDPFPGWRALLPVLGALMVILAEPSSGINRHFLSTRPMVAIGKISYPLYLWHWPLLALARILFGDLEVGLTMALLAISIALSWGTYYFIEKPIRRAAWGDIHPGRIVGAGLVLLVALGGLGDQTRLAKGFPARIDGDRGAGLIWDESQIRDGQCQAELGIVGDYCLRSHVGSVTNALIGDSHANHFFSGLNEIVLARGGNLLQLQGPVKPAADLAWANVDWLLQHREIATVLIAYHQGRIRETDNPFGPILEQMIARLLAGGKSVYLIIDNPGFDVDPRLCIRRPDFANWLGAGNDVERLCAESLEYMHRKRASYEDYLADLQDRYPMLQQINAFSVFCPDRRCAMLRDGRPLFRDRHHLTQYGAQIAFSQLSAEFALPLAKRRPISSVSK